jgi:hypothetical protein
MVYVERVRKEINYDLFRVNLGLYFLSIGIWIITLNDYYYFNTLQNSLLILAGLILLFIISILTIIPGYRRLKGNKKYINCNNKCSRSIYPALIINTLGFVLIGIAVFLMSFSVPLTGNLPAGNQFWHPYSFQSGIIFFAGTGSILLACLLYRSVIPTILERAILSEVDSSASLPVEEGKYE